MRSLGDSPPSPQPAGPGSVGPDRWQRVKAVFLEVVEQPPLDRETTLTRLCIGDDDLRREVESLLASEAEASGLLEQPAHSILDEADDADEGHWRPRLEIGTTLGPYEIVGFIAAGGMGEVYRARHTVLGRVVAIKTVGADLGDASGRRRLVREARHAATLKHRNICTIYEVGESAGDEQPFIVMEYLDGRSLRTVVHDGPRELGQILRVGIQVADALAHAHEHGIVHRDLKSSNIVIDSTGRVVVLDFGLAKRVSSSSDGPAGDSTLTTHGVVAGTLTHMAPEVLLGSPADARSDVWALGVLLYELATGRLPFVGRTSYETSAAIISDPPRTMSTRVPLALRLVIERCLAKKPEARYQRASDVGAALDAIERRRAWPLVGRLLVSMRRRTLRAIAAAIVLVPALVWAGAKLRPRIGLGATARLAILPLGNATGDSTAGYFADGMTDALIAQLGAATNVRVVSRASASRAAARARTTADVAKQLGASMLVQGTLRRTSGRVAVDMRLVEPTRGRALWSDKYERDASDVLALQADIVRALALAIRLTLRPEAEGRLATVRAVRPDVYEEFLKGRFEWNKRTAQSLQRAMAHFSRAVELDPTYAPAHAALADCYNQLGTVLVGTGSPKLFRPRAEAEAIRAMQIDPLVAEAHAALGYAKHYGLQWPEAEREFRRAIELNPSYSLVHVWYANLLMSQRRFDEALREVGLARELDPFSLIVNTNVAWILDFSGRYQAAIDQLRATLAIDSNYVQAHVRLAGALSSAGRFDEALAEAQRVVALTGRAPSGLGTLAVAQAEAGRKAEASATLTEILALAHAQYVPPWTIGAAYAALGNVDSAVVWVERAFDERSNFIAYLAVEPLALTLRHNPRFQRLLTRVGYR